MEDREVLIRPAEPGEEVILAEIEGICFPPTEAAPEEEVVRRFATFPENFIVAQLGERLVGFINGGNTDRPYLPDEMYHDVTLHRPDGLYQTVFGLNVLPQYRRKGIAEKLVREYIALARQRGKMGVILTCKDHMVHYYEKFGFQNFGMADSTHGGASWHDMRLIFDEGEVIRLQEE